MGLVDKLKGAKGIVQNVKSRDQFKEMYLDKLIESKELRSYFFEGDKKRDDERSRIMYDALTGIIDKEYDNYGRKQFEKPSLIKRFIAKPLRLAGASLEAYSHYLVNFYYSPEAYVMYTIPAVGAMAAADLLEGAEYLYHNHSGYDFLQVPKVLAESLLEKGLALLPFGVTVLPEAIAGSTKFDRAVARKILYESKNEFIKKFGKYEKPEKVYQSNVIEIPRRKIPELSDKLPGGPDYKDNLGNDNRDYSNRPGDDYKDRPGNMEDFPIIYDKAA